MRKLITAAALLLGACAAGAQTIPQLPPNNNISSADLTVLDQSVAVSPLTPNGRQTVRSPLSTIQNFWLAQPNTFVPLQTFLGGINASPLITPTVAMTLVNGLNSNIPVTEWRNRIAGPSGGFSIGGFTPVVDGFRLTIYNSTSQTMTIVNEDVSSTAANRIKTLTGANVVLRATAPSFATFSYDGTDARWILESTN